jgi:hypothetical protein
MAMPRAYRDADVANLLNATTGPGAANVSAGREIQPEEYGRCQELGEAHLRGFRGVAREGRPGCSMRPVGSGWYVSR